MNSLEDAYPLTTTQLGILFHSLQSDQADDYVAQVSFRVSGLLDTGLLNKSWDTVSTHHGALRSSFFYEGLEEPLCALHNTVSPQWNYVSATDVPKSRQREYIEQLVNQNSTTQIDPTQAPLYHFKVVRFSETDHVVVWTVHHLLADGWSFQIILEDLLSSYHSLCTGHSPKLSPSFSFKKFVNWNKTRDLAAAKDYWRNYLGSLAPSPIRLAKSNTLATTDAVSYDNRILHIFNAEESERIGVSCKDAHTTLGALTMAAWSLLLCEFSQCNSPMFGVTQSGRPITLDDSGFGVGLFINTLPLSIDWSAAGTIKELLTEIQYQLVSHASNDQLGLVDIQKLSQRENQEPLFDTVVAVEGHSGDLEVTSSEMESADNIRVSDIDYRIKSHYPISLLVLPGECIQLKIVFDNKQYSPSVVSTMMNRLVSAFHLLASKMESDKQDICSQFLQTRSVAQRPESQTTQVDFDVCDQFDEMVLAHPTRTAIIANGEKLSYSQLHNDVCMLANALTNTVVDFERPIGVLIQPSSYLVQSLLAILKAGGYYTPLDVQAPSDRIAELCRNAGIETVLTTEQLAADHSELAVQWMCLDSATAEWKNSTPEPIQIKPDDDQLAYVMFTSGSTGQPKGVKITRRNLAHSTAARLTHYNTPVECFMLMSAVTFDSSVAGIYWTLCSGGSLLLPDTHQLRELSEIGRLIEQYKVTHTLCLPSVYSLMLEHCSEAELDTLNTVIVAGEVCDGELVRNHYKHRSGAKLFNEYGPTEACVWCSVHECTPFDTDHVPVGRPVPHTSLLVIGANGNECSADNVGELWIGGPGVSPGYFNQNGKSEHFVTKRVINSEFENWYRTGDSAYWDASGFLHYVGRIDRQLKIRGVRIEPAEIESALVSIAGISKAVVIGTNNASNAGATRLLAFVTPDSSNSNVDHNKLCESTYTSLEQLLPPQLIPAKIQMVEFFPTLSNGKIDTNKLIESLSIPGDKPPQQKTDDPASTTLQVVQSSVAQVLGLPTVKLTDNFFSLGGDSIQSMKLCATLRHSLSVELGLREMLTCSTIEDIGLLIENMTTEPAPGDPLIQDSRPHQSNPESESQTQPLTAISVVDQSINPDTADPGTADHLHHPQETVHCNASPEQRQLWYLSKLDLPAELYSIQLGWQLDGELDISALKMSLNHIINRHESLRANLVTDIDGNLLQQIKHEITVELDCLEVTNETWQQEAKNFCQSPFSLETDALFRARLFRLPSGQFYLVVVVHHCIFDGWSVAIFQNELSVCYQHFSNNLPEAKIPLSPPASYIDNANELEFAPTLQNWEAQLEYWVKKLHLLPDTTLVRPDREQNPDAQPVFFGDSINRTVKPSNLIALEKIATATNSTLSMIFLAVYQSFLCRYSGQIDIVVGTTVSSRLSLERQDLIGFFNNTLVIRSLIDPDSTFYDILESVKHNLLEAQEHQDVPFERVVRALAPERKPGVNPLFTLFFLFQNNPVKNLEFSGLTVTPVSVPIRPTAKFDLSLEVRPVTATDQSGDSIHSGYEYNLNFSTELFEQSTMLLLADRFDAFMDSICANLETPIKQLNLHAEHDLSRISAAPYLASKTPDQQPAPSTTTIADLFSGICNSKKSSTALIEGGQDISYAQLQAQSLIIQNALQQAGCQAGEIVCVELPRSSSYIASVLAIVQLNAIWCPIDPNYPKDRKEFMRQNARARIYICSDNTGVTNDTDQGRQAVLELTEKPNNNSLTIRTLGSVKPMSTEQQRAARKLVSDGAAYLIYTSGSSGTPKGVVGTHHGMMNRFEWMTKCFPFSDDDVGCIKTSTSFVDSIWECFGPLVAGIPCVIIPDPVVTDPTGFLNEIRDYNITRIVVVPSLLDMMLSELERTNSTLPALRYCTSSGEALPMTVARRFQTLLPEATLLNLYGTSEVSADAVFSIVDSFQSGDHADLGIPISGNSVFLLNDYATEVPLGSVGNICIAGAGLALGYHRDTTQTQQAFSSTLIKGKRVYSSGDLGRWNKAGQLEFFGREDRQVKIRGHRIDCTGVDKVLETHPSVLRAFTIAVGENEQKRLVAAIECNSSNIPQDQAISEHAKKLLPNAHAPNHYLFLDHFPLGVNGKLDRAELSRRIKQNEESPLSKIPTIRDTTDDSNNSKLESLQEQLTDVWAELLNRPHLTRHENFFHVGGHSLLAIRLLQKMKVAASIDVTLAQLLRTPTVNSLATAIYRERTRDIDSGLTKIRDGKGSKNLFFIPPAGHSLIYFAPLVEHLNSQCNVYSIDSSESTNWNTLEAYASSIAEHIVSIQPTGPWLIGGVCYGNHIALEVCSQLPHQPGSISDLLLVDSGAPLNGPGWDFYQDHKIRKKKALRENALKYILNSCKTRGNKQLRRLRGVFNSNVREYIGIQTIQNKHFLSYHAQVVTANIIMIVSREYAKREEDIERWRSLTHSTFTCHYSSAKNHYELLNKRSSYWSQIAGLIDELTSGRSNKENETNSLTKQKHTKQVS